MIKRVSSQDMNSEQLDHEWLAELERRTKRAHDEPNGGIPWEEVRQRLAARISRR